MNDYNISLSLTLTVTSPPLTLWKLTLYPPHYTCQF